MKSTFIVLLALLGFGFPVWSAQFRYNELLTKDYDEMNTIVQSQLKKSRAVGSNSSDEATDDQAAIGHLRDALKLVFSRPNSDNMVAKLTPELRRELVGYSAYESTVASLASEALAVLQNKKATISSQGTAIFMLENIMGEIRPEAADNAALRQILEKVKAAKLEIPSDVIKDMKLRAMFHPRNPSDVANEMLKNLPKKRADRKSED